jgi:subtilase family serine protease
MGMRSRYLAVVVLAAAAAALAAGAAHATPFQPASDDVLFTPLSRHDVQQAPTCQNGLLCYTPQMIQQAYDFPKGRSAPTGAGETVVVVTAYGSPFLEADVALFNGQFGLPPATIVPFPQQTVLAPDGSGDVGHWALETTLDVEAVHATAPGARIVLAVAANDDTSNVAEVEREVSAAYPDAIIVQSFGIDEAGPISDPDAMTVMDKVFASQALHGGSVVAAAGDYGATGLAPFYGFEPVPVAGYPASSPLVLSVGGTQGNPYPGGLWNRGRYGREQVWNEVFSDGSAGAGGGGPSVVYPKPLWQLGIVAGSGRATPDVAYDAASNGGIIICFQGTFGVIGGTSASAPQWAGILALANELRARAHRPQVGLVTPLLYLLARDRSTYKQDFHDITVGTNSIFGADSGVPGFAAGPGYDYPTGLGTPDVARLLDDLAGRDALFNRLGDLLTSHGHRHGRVSFRPGR